MMMVAASQALQPYGITHSQARRAFSVALRSHGGQHYGPYTYGYHLRHVIAALKKIGFSTYAHRAVAALHDVIEDTGATLDEIKERFGGEVAAAVEMLTRRADLSTPDYISRMNPLAFAVKLADRYCNLRALGRIAGQRHRDRERRLPKYIGEMDALLERAAALGPDFETAAAAVARELEAARARL